MHHGKNIIGGHGQGVDKLTLFICHAAVFGNEHHLVTYGHKKLFNAVILPAGSGGKGDAHIIKLFHQLHKAVGKSMTAVQKCAVKIGGDKFYHLRSSLQKSFRIIIAYRRE